MDTHRGRCRFRRCGNLVIAVSPLLNNSEVFLFVSLFSRQVLFPFFIFIPSDAISTREELVSVAISTALLSRYEVLVLHSRFRVSHSIPECLGLRSRYKLPIPRLLLVKANIRRLLASMQGELSIREQLWGQQ